MIALLLAQTIAITGGTVYPVSGPKIENATVLIRDGKIAAVGTNVAVPAGATRIDASGKWVTPGLIDGAGQMGLREIGAVQNTNEATLRGNEVAASFNVLEGLNPASTLIAVNRMEGITTTLGVVTFRRRTEGPNAGGQPAGRWPTGWPYSGREMPSFFIFHCKVERFMPRPDAAPFGPRNTQWAARRARRMCSRSASARR